MREQVVERATTAIATGAVIGPLWLPHIEKALSLSVSTLGIVWLLIQIFYKIKNGK